MLLKYQVTESNNLISNLKIQEDKDHGVGIDVLLQPFGRHCHIPHYPLPHHRSQRPKIQTPREILEC